MLHLSEDVRMVEKWEGGNHGQEQGNPPVN